MSKYLEVISRTPFTLRTQLKYSLHKQPKLSTSIFVFDSTKIYNYATGSTCTNLFASNKIYASTIRTLRGVSRDILRASQRHPADNALASFEQFVSPASSHHLSNFPEKRLRELHKIFSLRISSNCDAVSHFWQCISGREHFLLSFPPAALDQAIQTLVACGFSGEDVLTVFGRAVERSDASAGGADVLQRVCALSPDAIRERVHMLEELNVEQSAAANAFAREPVLLLESTQSLSDRIDDLLSEEHLFSRRKVGLLATHTPSALLREPSDLLAIGQYLVDHMNFSVFTGVHTTVFLHPLQRLQCRHLFLVLAGLFKRTREDVNEEVEVAAHTRRLKLRLEQASRSKSKSNSQSTEENTRTQRHEKERTNDAPQNERTHFAEQITSASNTPSSPVVQPSQQVVLPPEQRSAVFKPRLGGRRALAPVANPTLKQIVDTSNESFALHVAHLSLEEYETFCALHARGRIAVPLAIEGLTEFDELRAARENQELRRRIGDAPVAVRLRARHISRLRTADFLDRDVAIDVPVDEEINPLEENTSLAASDDEREDENYND